MLFTGDYFIEIVLFLGALQSFILGMVLHFKKGKGHRIYLAYFLITIGLILFGSLLQRSVAWSYGVIIDPLVLLLGPCLYFYVIGFSGKITVSKLLKHSMFLILYIGILTWFAFTVINEHGWSFQLADFIKSNYSNHSILIILAIGKVSHLLFYSALSIRAQKHHERQLLKFYSEIGELNLRWVKRLIIAFLALIAITFLSFTAQFLSKEWITTFAGLNLALLTVFVYYIAYHALNQPAIFSGAIKLSDNQVPKPTEKYKASKLDNSVSEVLKNEIVNLMESKKLYLESELSIQHLANEVNQSVHIVSQVLNDVIGLNFYEFVNKYRVEEAKNLLKDRSYRHLNILAIGLMAGFNSKTSFNTTFKKYTGLTPSKYQKSTIG
ncbi:MAG: helix-turn-helix domain-containing protein [Fulvivirga sp.]|uniref:helix-turn-helix domain-containing protein n=1 Tax=Fulvivirga sp. TaxID=1931237 RepID=UPI0032ECC8A9